MLWRAAAAVTRPVSLATWMLSSRARCLHALPSLKFSVQEGLAPVFSARQLDFHYHKHHNTYVEKLNALIKDDPELSALPLEEIIRETASKTGATAIFNNAAQHFNHSFYWACMTSKPTPPSEAVKQALSKDFGSLEGFQKKFQENATLLFGSGWTWLVKGGDGKLSIVNTTNAGTPLVTGDQTPILTCDVWEHAYYLDHQNRRPDYLSAWWQVVDWQFVEENLSK